MIPGMLDAAMTIPKFMHDEEMQEDAQVYSATQAATQRDFQERMANTQYQRATRDMIASGLNPMLAARQGGAESPSGAMGSAGISNTGGGSSSSFAHGAATASQIAVNDATINKTDAETEEIKARTPTHGVSIEQMQTNIRKLIAETSAVAQGERTSAAGEAKARQEIDNLRMSLQHIAASVDLLRQQKVANLPQIERAMKDVELEFMELERPRRGQESSSNARFVGALGALLRTLNPLGGLIRSVK